jgi:peptidoglycan lytic transglycosylase
LVYQHKLFDGVFPQPKKKRLPLFLRLRQMAYGFLSATKALFCYALILGTSVIMDNRPIPATKTSAIIQKQPPTPLVLRPAVASWYGPPSNGQNRADGTPYPKDGVFVANKTLPFGTKLYIRNPRNGRHIIAPVRDRGPFIEGRTIDLSQRAAELLDAKESGVVSVKYAIIKSPREGNS